MLFSPVRPGIGQCRIQSRIAQGRVGRGCIPVQIHSCAIVNNNQINAIWSSAASGMQFFNVESQLVLLLPSRNRLEIKITNVAG